jgi:hypothetical protein
MSNEEISKTADAVKAVAVTTGKAIDATQQLGGFIAKYVAGPLEQGMGIVEDRFKYMRWERQVRLMKRAEQLLREVGLDAPTRAIPLNLALPLLEAASLEDDDHLQDLWARLLVNAANENSQVTVKRAYIAILEQLTPLDATILEKIYALPYENTRHDGVRTHNLPFSASAGGRNEPTVETLEPSDDVKLGLANLARLGCITIQKSWGNGEIFTSVNPTLLGKAFIEACTLQGA